MMITLDTPPGTDVAFIGLIDGTIVNKSLRNPAFGDICAVVKTRPSNLTRSGGVVQVVEYPGWFCLSCFRLLEKPVELYSLLERAPVKETV